MAANPVNDQEDHGADLRQELAAVLNRHSAENGSDTPDFILATYLLDCLKVWNEAVRERDRWYGHTTLRQRLGIDESGYMTIRERPGIVESGPAREAL